MNGDVTEVGNHYVNLYLNRNHWNLDDHWRNLPCCYATHDLCDCWVFYNNTFFVAGIIGFTVPSIATINNFTILYIAAAWLLIHGILTIIAAVDSKDKGAGKIQVIFGVV